LSFFAASSGELKIVISLQSTGRQLSRDENHIIKMQSLNPLLQPRPKKPGQFLIFGIVNVYAN